MVVVTNPAAVISGNNFKMRFSHILLLLFALYAIALADAKTTKKSAEKESAVASEENNTEQKAIIAIEIINPNENATKDGKGRKRTIEQALGYGIPNGYQSFFSVKPKPPRYEMYKYTEDIPAFKSNNYNYHAPSNGKFYPRKPQRFQAPNQPNQQQQQSRGHTNYQVQKSIQYELGHSAPIYIAPKAAPNLQQYYQHGTTLFSTLDQNGAVGGLSSEAPANHGPMVPVIILRVYTNQLQDGALHPNIPQSHPYANLNNLDLSSLLSKYVTQHTEQQQQYHQPEVQSVVQPAVQPVQQTPQQYETPPAEYGPPVHQNQQYQQVDYHQQEPGLLTGENYPDDAHTKVIFHKKVPQAQNSYENPGQKFKITIPANTFSKVEIQDHTAYNAEPENQQQVEYQVPEPQVQVQQQPQYYYHHQQQYQPVEDPNQQYQQVDLGQQNLQYYEQPIGHQQYQQQYFVQSPLVVQYQQPHQQGNAAEEQHHQQQQQSFIYSTPEQGNENHNYSIIKHSNDAGRDLHPKVFNYHAHPQTQYTQHAHKQRSTPKKKRSRSPLAPLLAKREQVKVKSEEN